MKRTKADKCFDSWNNWETCNEAECNHDCQCALKLRHICARKWCGGFLLIKQGFSFIPEKICKRQIQQWYLMEMGPEVYVLWNTEFPLPNKRKFLRKASCRFGKHDEQRLVCKSELFPESPGNYPGSCSTVDWHLRKWQVLAEFKPYHVDLRVISRMQNHKHGDLRHSWRNCEFLI